MQDGWQAVGGRRNECNHSTPDAGEGRGMSLRVLDLFSGIGGFSLGLERTGGFETVAFCEIDPFCRRVLAEALAEREAI